MEISKQSRIYEIEEDKNYLEEQYGISRDDYKQSFEDKGFLYVDR